MFWAERANLLTCELDMARRRRLRLAYLMVLLALARQLEAPSSAPSSPGE